MAPKLNASVADRVIRSLFALTRAVEEALEFHAHPSGLGLDMSSNKLRALCLLDQPGDRTPTDLARFLNVTTGGMTGLLDSLERAGLVKRVRKSKDRREVILTLTASGRRFVGTVRQQQRRILQSAHRKAGFCEAEKWVATPDQISSALMDATGTFRELCLQCGAYADGQCVLQNPENRCPLVAATPSTEKKAQRSSML